MSMLQAEITRAESQWMTERLRYVAESRAYGAAHVSKLTARRAERAAARLAWLVDELAAAQPAESDSGSV